MVSVFGDESHDETKQRVFAVAALLGSQDEWDALESEWLPRTGGREFHAADCEGGHGEFAQTSHQENLALYRDLTKLIARTRMLGFGVGIDLAGFSEAFPDALPDYPYFMCFLRVIKDCAEAAYLLIPRETVKFTFDHRPDAEHHASSIYDYMTTQTEWKSHSCLHGEVGFASRKVVPIQAADLLARETMKHLDNQLGLVQRPMRGSMRELDGTGRFRFTYHVAEYFQDLKSKMQTLENLTGLKESNYATWLKEHNVLDNRSNRLRYLIYFENQERRQKES